MSTVGDHNNNNKTTFQIKSTKSYVSIVTLSTKDNVNVTEHLNDVNNPKKFPLDASFQGFN